MKKTLSKFFYLLILSSCFHHAYSQTTIFITRHADRYGTEPDPSLTPKGQEQAHLLGLMLSDANIKHIFTTEFVRTQQTAAPTAHAAHITPVVIPQINFDELITQIRSSMKPHESILVVGHRATVPKIVHALTGKNIEPLGSGEYGRLIAITLFEDGTSSLVTLRYASKIQEAKDGSR